MRLISDDEMIHMIRLGNDDAVQMLYAKYESFLRSWALKSLHTQKAKHVELADMLQVAHKELWQVIQKYRNEEGNFYTFLKLCVERELYIYIKTFLANVIPHYREISLDEPLYDDSGYTYLDIYEVATSEVPLDRTYELREEIEQIYHSNLTKTETQIVSMKMIGHSYQDIASALSMSRKQVDNHLARIKVKVRIRR